MGQIIESPKFTATAMGAVPYKSVDRAVRTMFDHFPTAPCLPVTTRSIRWMLEGIPCLVIDREKRTMCMACTQDLEHEMLEFYDQYEKGNLEYFGTSRQTAPFLYGMIDWIHSNSPEGMKWVLFHIGGAALLGDVIKQANGIPIFHDDTLRDVIIKAVNMKTRWLMQKLRNEMPGAQIIPDLSETTLVNFTSAQGTGLRNDVVGAINAGFEGLDCPTFIHCCANIDWSLLTDSTVDIINFDAYQYAEKASLYAREFKNFIGRGGMIAWGIVPVIADLLEGETVDSLVDRLQRSIAYFVRGGIDEEKLASASWVLPCCETILLTEEQSDRVFEMTVKISRVMRERYGFET
jgi:hypothetical protein